MITGRNTDEGGGRSVWANIAADKQNVIGVCWSRQHSPEPSRSLTKVTSYFRTWLETTKNAGQLSGFTTDFATLFYILRQISQNSSHYTAMVTQKALEL